MEGVEEGQGGRVGRWGWGGEGAVMKGRIQSRERGGRVGAWHVKKPALGRTRAPQNTVMMCARVRMLTDTGGRKPAFSLIMKLVSVLAIVTIRYSVLLLLIFSQQ